MTDEKNLREITARSLLEALDGIAYLIDLNGKILAVGERNWTSFARANDTPDLSVDSIINRDFRDFISGDEIRSNYQRMIDAVVLEKSTEVVFPYRCDAPDIERYMQMSLSPVRSNQKIEALLFQSKITSEKFRPQMNLFSRQSVVRSIKESHAREILRICSYCYDVYWSPDAAINKKWMTAAEYYSLGGQEDVSLSHGVCLDCQEIVEKSIHANAIEKI